MEEWRGGGVEGGGGRIEARGKGGGGVEGGGVEGGWKIGEQSGGRGFVEEGWRGKGGGGCWRGGRR